ncbi:MAG: hypothetical protein J6J79_00020 [Lachnospiraceae bacterium]|nr:hypothetical protein [Lachnospiraceae bacterium]
MQVVEFTYRSTMIKPSVFLFWFLRFNGIYVCEHFLDIKDETKKVLYSQITGGRNISEFLESNKGDVEICLVCDEDDLEDFHKNQSAKKISDVPIVLLISDSLAEQQSYETNGEAALIIYRGNCDVQLLMDIIHTFHEMNLIDDEEREELDCVANWFCSMEIHDLILRGKYFYPTEEHKEFEVMADAYRKAYDALDVCLHTESFFADSGIYSQYALINMQYEMDLYCVRCNKAKLIPSTDLAVIGKSFLAYTHKRQKLEASASMLLAQIYDDLLMDPNVAYEYYLPACKPYNAYAYFKKGIYWKNKKEMNKAKEYYRRSLLSYPEYYRAWYNLGTCYFYDQQYELAVNAFHNVGAILKTKWSKHVLRTLEIDYLFNAYKCCAYIYNKCFNNINLSIWENLNAVRVWEEIDKSKFWEIISSQNDRNLKEKAKKRLDITQSYQQIYKLALKAGNEDLIREFRQKLIKIGE